MRVYKRGKKAFTAQELAEKVEGLSYRGARYRLLQWERGKIPTKNLFLPKKSDPKPYREYHKTKRYQMLYPWEREMLDKIPGPTEFEKKYL